LNHSSTASPFVPVSSAGASRASRALAHARTATTIDLQVLEDATFARP
jgi:hypothetical protein